MKIALIAPPVVNIPPIGQGGLETILANKIDALKQLGHEVSLYAAGETTLTGIDYHRIYDKAIKDIEVDPITMEASRKLRLEATYIYQVLLLLLKDQDKYDVIFNHTRSTELAVAPLTDKFHIPFINIFHLPILPEHARILSDNPDLLAISISDDQRSDYPDLENFIATVHNGIDAELYPFNGEPDDYLLWVGTIGYHKNPLDAIRVAKKLNTKLIMMGKIRDEEYFDRLIKPEIGKNVEYLGELGYSKKLSYFQRAKVALFPTKIREACPVTPIEISMCGTPVIAYPSGGTKELIKNGVNGFLVSSIDELARRVDDASDLSRLKCHEYTKNNFSSKRMAENYIESLRRI